MTRPKGKLFALLAIFAAIGLVAATGAFSNVSAARTVSVEVAGDDAALLQLDSGSSYAEGQSSGAISFDFESTNDPLAGQGAEGINPDAVTNVDEILNVTNQGDRDVTISYTKSSDTQSILTVYNASSTDTEPGDTPSAFGTATLGPGDTVRLGFSFDTTGVNSGDFDISLTVEADDDA